MFETTLIFVNSFALFENKRTTGVIEDFNNVVLVNTIKPPLSDKSEGDT